MSANDAPQRDPKDLTFKGSNDGVIWATLDSRANESFSTRLQRKEYAFNNTIAFSYYRMEMTNHGGPMLQLNEWEIYGRPVDNLPEELNIVKFGGTLNIATTGAGNQLNGEAVAKYVIPQKTGSLEYRAETNSYYIVTKYTITSSDASAENDPKSWELQASNDNLEWITLDSRSDEKFSERHEVKRWKLNNRNQYRYYRVAISANNGGSAVQLSDLELYGMKGSGVSLPAADFSAEDRIIMAGESVTFRNTSQNAASCVWDFPGGTPSKSTDQNPTVKYDSAGIYSVALTVSDGKEKDKILRSDYINIETIDKQQIAEQIRQEFLFCWDAYKKYAMGHDELNPLAKSSNDWYGESFLMTPVDALDTMILMELKEEADINREYIVKHLSFNKNSCVSNFEFTIRFLGGLLSSFQLTGDERLLGLAKDLADRELAAFKSPTGMPYGDVNLMTGEVKREVTNPAEIGTLLLEFGTLSKVTGDTIYYNTAKRALQELYRRSSSIGLVGSSIDVTDGTWKSKECHISGGIDSYFEYLIKCTRLFDDKDCAKMWEPTIQAINTYLVDSTAGGFWYGHVNMETGKRTRTQFGSLDAFFPAVLTLSGDIRRAAQLEESCWKMWNRYGIEPEQFNYARMEATSPGYYLRPEIIESAYYLYQHTQNPRYLLMGKVFFNNLRKYCRTPNGYVNLSSVITKEKEDGMPSYFLAETLKYLYLLFAPSNTLDLKNVIFNTEAHPLRKTW